MDAFEEENENNGQQQQNQEISPTTTDAVVFDIAKALKRCFESKSQILKELCANNEVCLRDFTSFT